MNDHLKKYIGRFGAAVFIYLFFKVTSSHSPDQLTFYDTNTYIFFVLTVIVVVSVWEVCDRHKNFFLKKYHVDLTSKKRVIQLFIAITLTTFPLVMLYIYVENFHIKRWLDCIEESQLSTVFWSETTKALLITWMIIGFEIFKLYVKHSHQIEKDKARMQKELLLSKYESLKNQLNPHFLFNSYSVLTTLIHQNPDLAVDFLNQLSNMYRYILDNNSNQMVSLEQEFKFLESYLFLLKTRHENSIHINMNIGLELKNFFVPTLAVQMLIENAIKHNAFSVEHPLEINIFSEGQDFLVISNIIRKTGNRVYSTKIGLENICKRYNMHSERQVVVNQENNKFVVKLPILSMLPAT